MDWSLIAEASAVLGKMSEYTYIALGLGFVIFVHELGHFLAAKACGVKCEKFYIGFDIPTRFLPSSLVKFQWGETEYGIGILPLGGYVKMLGQDDNPANQAKENERIKVRTDDDGDGSAESAEGEDEFELDPRSYPAKPVWQRMIIISAGVIMNVIFAVVLAAVAYRMGVRYTPCVIGGTAPGDPAWIENLHPGDKIIQIGRDDPLDEALRFRRDLSTSVSLNGGDRPIDFLVRRPGLDESMWISLTPNGRFKGKDAFPTIGVRPPQGTHLNRLRPYDSYRFGGESYERLEGNDQVVAVDGESLPIDEETGEILNWQLETRLLAKLDQPVTMTIRRESTEGSSADSTAAVETFDVALPPSPLRTLGMAMEISPIVAVQKGSPAETAGFRVADRLVTIAGDPVGDPLVLDQRMRQYAGQEITVEVERDGQTIPLTVTPRTPKAFTANAVVGCDALGVAFTIPGRVASVEPGGPAETAGLQPGDRIAAAQFVAKEEQAKSEAAEFMGKDYFDPLVLSEDEPEWPLLNLILQASPNGVAVQFNVERDGKLLGEPITVTPEYSDQWYEAYRGLNFKLVSKVRTAESWGEAWSLGYRETKEKLLEVLLVLQKLFTGKISFFKLGSPVMIVAVAGAEASEGLPRLLIFLTFLSANLAILNFLPIPALDGGHMVFLAAEWVRGKPVNEKLQITLTLISIAVLLSLMAILFTLDIQRIFL